MKSKHIGDIRYRGLDMQKAPVSFSPASVPIQLL